MKPNKQKIDWETEFDKQFHTTWIRSHDSMIGLNPVYTGEKIYLVDSFKVKSFISQLLKTQREEIVSEIEGIVGESEVEFHGPVDVTGILDKKTFLEKLKNLEKK